MAKQVLLVGSVPLSSETDVFREVSERLGMLARRVPDGETGDRAKWTAWQAGVIERTGGIVRTGDRDVHGIPFRTYAIEAGGSPDHVKFPSLGYAAAAKQSYRVFDAMRRDGIVHAERFQVCLPTPLAVVQGFFWGSPDLPAICAVYERRLLAEL